jgi:hypothetical protein
MAIASFKWQPASGQQIGFPGDKPINVYGPSFTADDVHGQAYNPNTPNSYAMPGEIGEVPVQIQDAGDYFDYMDGSNGWILDNINDPWHGLNPGTAGHNPDMDAVGTPRVALDTAHDEDIYQLAVPGGYGRDIYGKTIEDNEVYNWYSPSVPGRNAGTSPLDARVKVENWPEPFDVYEVARKLRVVRPTEKIPMRRIAEDDRPVYRQLAIPGQNIKPSGSVYTPTMQSNPVIHNVKPLPAFGRTPQPPWTQDELASPDDQGYMDYTDVFGGMGLQ